MVPAAEFAAGAAAQVPLPFAATGKHTLDFKGAKKVHVAQPGSGLDKRQATLQICFNAHGEGKCLQPPVGIIFRGTGTGIKGAEWAAYDPRVHVYFQARPRLRPRVPRPRCRAPTAARAFQSLHAVRCARVDARGARASRSRAPGWTARRTCCGWRRRGSRTWRHRTVGRATSDY